MLKLYPLSLVRLLKEYLDNPTPLPLNFLPAQGK